MKIREFLSEIGSVILAFLLLNILLGIEGLPEFFGGLLHHIGISLLAIALIFSVRLYFLRKELSALFNHWKSLPNHIRNVVLIFRYPQLIAHFAETEKLANEGLMIDQSEIEQLVDISFSTCSGSYQGTDRNPPSSFNKLYPTYLKQQHDRKSFGRNYDSRFLIVTREELEQDYTLNKEDFVEFCDSHLTNSIILLQVDPENVKKIAEKYTQLPSTDIGIFNWKFIIFYTPPNESEPLYKIQIIPMEKKSAITKQVAHFLIDINKAAKRVEIEDGKVKLKGRENEEIQQQRQRMFEGRDWPEILGGSRQEV